MILLFLFFSLGICAGASGTKPAAPELSASNVSSGRVRLRWDMVKGAECYRIYRSKSKTGGYSCIKTTTSTGYTDTDGAVGRAYYYCVKAVDDAGNVSDTSNKVKATRKLARPEITLSNAASSGKIRISWEKISDADAYRIYRSTDKKNWTRIRSTTAVSYVDTDAEAETLYYYRVLAVAASSAGNSDFSSVKSRTCRLPRPAVKLTNTGTITLSWKAVPGAVSYRIYRSTGKDGTYERIRSQKNSIFSDTTVVPNTAYYYKVKAVAGNSSANSSLSPAVEAVSSTFHGLQYVMLQVSVNDSGVPLLEWNPVSNGCTYRIYRSLYPDSGFSCITTKTVPYHTNYNAPQGLTVYYKVEALDSSGQTLAMSEVSSVTTPDPNNETRQTMYVAMPIIKVYPLPDVGSSGKRLRYMDSLELGSCISTTDTACWYRVFLDGELMYLRIAHGASVLTDTPSCFYYTGDTPWQQAVLDLATDISENWDTVYVSGMAGETANEEGACGFNCSGLVKYVFNNAMAEYVPTYSLTASLQWLTSVSGLYNTGYPGEFQAEDIALADLRPGDILFFKSNASGAETSAIGHCGIYLGNGEFVHSTSLWEDSVCIVPLSGTFADTLTAIRRFLPDQIQPANTVVYTGTSAGEYPVYSAMSTTSDVLITVAPGSALPLLFSGSSWAYVRTGDSTEGYLPLEQLQ